ncbi:hypothetical protein EUX98_g7126 [Antrodiella citrinella]|uniref:PDCD5-related protein n=1 Tax=Antrodiella citrinella TaxID=2447956 RepID=A0A4S4MPS8_9APHY|nr:hypothetical protein EUX98_g7126 [Antrodiella citrinella]
MADPELAAIRAARMNQLQQQGGAPGGGAEDESKRVAEEQMRLDLLATVLDNAARERRACLFVARNTKLMSLCIFATRIIDLPSNQRCTSIAQCRASLCGQLRGRVTEQQLIDLLEQADDAQSKGAPKKGAIVFQRRKGGFDSDDDFDI